MSSGSLISSQEFEEACITLRGRVNERDLEGLQLLLGILDTYQPPIESREWLECLQETIKIEDWDAAARLFEIKGA
jgi:hypothetical protein